MLTIAAAIILMSATGILDGSSFYRSQFSYAQSAKGLNCYFCHTQIEPEDDKGCLHCHELVEVKSKRKQAFLLDYARRMFGIGRGYECFLCHQGNPSSKDKEEAHRGFLPDPASTEALKRGSGCYKCHFENAEGKMATQMLPSQPLESREILGLKEQQ